MLVKAKWNVKDSSGWHDAGEVFQTDDDLGDAVECLEAPKKAPVKEPAKEPVVAAEKAPEAETEKEQPKAKTAGRRRASK